jgi:tripartite-type tricarboxylate transporter receptor subunit TctC
MTMKWSRRRAIAALWAATQAADSLAGSQPAWPWRPVRVIVVYPPGGLSDGMARALAERLAQQLGVAVRVENRSGGGGNVGLQALARAPADGHTLAFSAVSPLTLRPHLGSVGYDPFRDVAPVASVMQTPVLLVGTPAFSGQGFADLLALARARPGALRWATSGLATAGHLVLEQVQLGAAISVTHVPYKGGGQQLTDALGGQFELLSTNVAPAQLTHIEAGRFKPLAVGAPQRLEVLAHVPTFAELGLPQANITSLFGLFAPGGTPPPVLDRLNAEINAAVRSPPIQKRLLASDNLPAPGDRASFEQRIAQEWRSNRRLKGTHIKMD